MSQRGRPLSTRLDALLGEQLRLHPGRTLLLAAIIGWAAGRALSRG